MKLLPLTRVLFVSWCCCCKGRRTHRLLSTSCLLWISVEDVRSFIQQTDVSNCLCWHSARAWALSPKELEVLGGRGIHLYGPGIQGQWRNRASSRARAGVDGEQVPGSRSSRSQGSSVLNILRNLPDCFPERLHRLTFSQQCVRVLVSPHPHQHLWWCILLILALLEGANRHLIVVCVSLATNDAEHLSVGLLVSYIPFWNKCLFKSFVRFEIQWLLILIAGTHLNLLGLVFIFWGCMFVKVVNMVVI